MTNSYEKGLNKNFLYFSKILENNNHLYSIGKCCSVQYTHNDSEYGLKIKIISIYNIYNIHTIHYIYNTNIINI